MIAPMALTDVIGWLYLIALAFSPVIFGANVPMAWGLNAGTFGLLMAAYSIGHAVSRRPFPVAISKIGGAVTAFAIVTGWIYLQAQTWTPAVVQNPAWAEAGSLLGTQIPGAISVNPSETLLGLLRLITAATVFFLALQLANDASRAHRIVAAIAVAGAVHAVYVFLLSAAGPQLAGQVLPASLFKLDQGPETHYSGLFINRNHLAISLGLATLAAWGLFFRDVRAGLAQHGYHGQRETVAKLLNVATTAGRYALLFFPLLGALFLTTSRAGVALTFVAVFTIVALEGWRSQSGQSSLATKIAMGVAIAGVVVALTAQGDLIGARLAGGNFGSDVGGRLSVAVATLRAVADQPLLGWGYGTFHNVFPLYRDDTIPISSGKWLEAHNSYLEALLGLGIPAATLLFFALGSLIWRCFRGALTRRRNQTPPQVACGAALIVGFHSLVDFSVQLQGITIPFAALLGAGVAQAWSTRSDGRRTK